MYSCNRNKVERGFTLLEVLLVLALIAIFASMVKIPTFSKSIDEQIEEEAKRIAVLVDMASEYAILNNQLLGFAIKDNGYEFLAFNGKSWQVISEPPLEPRQLPDAVSMELSLDGLPWSENNLVNSVSWQAEEDDDFSLQTDEKEQEAKFPQVFLLPSGELSAFEIVLDSGDFEVANHKMLVRGVFTTPVRVGREEELQDDLY